MVYRTVPTWGSRLRYTLLACAMVATLIQLVPAPPARGLAGDTGPAIVPGSSTFSLENTNGQWDTKNQHRVWYNTDRNEWDAILPMDTIANGGPASVASAWWIVQEAVPSAPGSAPTNDIEVSTNPQDRPDVFWDQSANTLYVLMSGATTQFYRYTYAAGSYTLSAGPISLNGMNVAESRAAIYKDPVNGDLWASELHGGGLLVARSTDNGDNWSTPVTLGFPVSGGQTQLTSFTDTNSYLAVVAAEDGDSGSESGRYSEYLFYKLDLANVANWTSIVHSTVDLNIVLQPTAGETIKIGDTTYTFQTSPIVDAPGNVAIGASLAATQTNLVDAINGTGTPGPTTYAATTPRNGDVAILAPFAANVATLTAYLSGARGNLALLETMAGAGNEFAGAATAMAGGETSAWSSEVIELTQGTAEETAVVHSDDELSVVTYNNVVYIATETQRTGEGTPTEIMSDPQVILLTRSAGATWDQSNVEMDHPTSDQDRKRPVVAIMDETVYVIAVDNPQSDSSYWTKPIASIPTLGTGWGSTTTLFHTEFQAYRNNIVPRDRVTTSQRLPVLVDSAPNTEADDTDIWQTSLPNNGNQAPGANAGADKTVAATPATDLGSTVTNDALGGPVNWSWAKVSGPGTVTFTNGSGSCATTACDLPTTAVFTTLGVYVLRLTATESGTNPLSNTDEVTITVSNAVNTPPVLTVTSPSNGDNYAQGESVSFSASAIDNEAGDISVDIAWTSSIDGSIGFGGSFVKTDLSLGTHSIVANVTDGQNPVSSSPISISVTVGGGGGGGGGGVNFIDIDGNTFEADIIWLAEQGITKGCNPPKNDMFCPNKQVTRGQMAAFLTRAFGYTNEGTGNYFVDTVGNTFEHDINKMFVAGVTKGCNPPANNNYCPGKNVTRAQMAAFLVRAFGYTNAGTGDYFLDTVGSIFEIDIDKLRVSGVTKGCNPPANNLYCPASFVTRGQMAAFLHRGFGG